MARTRRFGEAANLISYVRRDFDKGKAIERWRRKVTGLMGPGGPYDGGTAGIQSTAWTASVPPGDELAW
jgi:hypothetical protein